MNLLAIKELQAQIERKDAEINRLNGLIVNPEITYCVDLCDRFRGGIRLIDVAEFEEVYSAIAYKNEKAVDDGQWLEIRVEG